MLSAKSELSMSNFKLKLRRQAAWKLWALSDSFASRDGNHRRSSGARSPSDVRSSTATPIHQFICSCRPYFHGVQARILG
jgi:hypothetical protein